MNPHLDAESVIEARVRLQRAVDKPAEIAALKKSWYNFLKEYRTYVLHKIGKKIVFYKLSTLSRKIKDNL